MVNGKNMRKSATSKSDLCSCKKASSLRSSRSSSSSGAASRRQASLGRTLDKKVMYIRYIKHRRNQLHSLLVDALQRDVLIGI